MKRLLAVLAIVSNYASAQTPNVKPAAATPIPRTHDGKPDLNGVWDIPYVQDMFRGAGDPPFTPTGAADYKAYNPADFDYTAHCLPMGLTRQMNTPMPLEIFQTSNKVAILFEAWDTWRIIPTDSRPHPKKLDPTWMGNSVGRWEGDTLVIDSTGFNDKTRLDTIGHPHSDSMHVIERFERADATHIAYEITVDDPVMYTKPIVNKRRFTLKPTWELMEYSCEENNKDVNEGHLK
ncbi:MAG TPA: hypothetical protein VGJ09_02195 [Bryobacteraceae bacterium]|jgi:hypothetical protein